MRPWIVQPHDAIRKLETELWAVQSDVPDMPLRRWMGIARLRDGRLAFLNAVPLREESMRDLESWGEPALLLVPNGYHRLDIAPFKARYPKLQVLCGAGQRARVEKVLPVDGGWEKFPTDPRVQLIPLRGTKGEAVVRVRGTLVAFGDVIMNLPHLPGLKGLVLRLFRSSGGPRVTGIGKLFLVDDKRALKQHLEEMAATPGLQRILPCHGGLVDRDAGNVLRGIAARA